MKALSVLFLVLAFNQAASAVMASCSLTEKFYTMEGYETYTLRSEKDLGTQYSALDSGPVTEIAFNVYANVAYDVFFTDGKIKGTLTSISGGGSFSGTVDDQETLNLTLEVPDSMDKFVYELNCSL